MPRTFLIFVAKYFYYLQVAYHEVIALLGFSIFVILIIQIYSGFSLALSLVENDSMLIPLVREEEDIENLYVDDWFFLHERGVDLLIILSVLHLLRKLYINAMSFEAEGSWKHGILLFLSLQVIIFFGLTLCCTHLSDITLKIAANIFHTATLFIGKLYWLLFTDQNLNADTLARLAYLHYITGISIIYLGSNHGVDMHYHWRVDTISDGVKQELPWMDEAFLNEVSLCIDIYIVFGTLALLFFSASEPLSYELFMWGDIGMSVDVRFYGVAPHWYFRPYMAWLVACPFHYAGIIGLIVFFFSFYFQYHILGLNSVEAQLYDNTKNNSVMYYSLMMYTDKKHLTFYTLGKTYPSSEFYYELYFSFFLVALWYICSYLPYGRFYNRIQGNIETLFAYWYIFIYLGTPIFRQNYSYKLYIKAYI